jgi:hypothetical protein
MMPVVQRQQSLLVGPVWSARCARCGETVSKYDFTSDKAQAALDLHLKVTHGIEVDS